MCQAYSNGFNSLSLSIELQRSQQYGQGFNSAAEVMTIMQDKERPFANECARRGLS
jgi:hypothetical protein